jgi:hypothetical protein
MKTRQKLLEKYLCIRNILQEYQLHRLPLNIYSANYSSRHCIVGNFYLGRIVKYDGFSTPEIDRTINKGTLHSSSQR